MRKVLYIFGLLNDTDVEWMSQVGKLITLDQREVLIRQGERLSQLYILIEGRMDVSITGIGVVASLSSGEMLGEMSFVDNSPTSATVVAQSQTKLLELSRADLEARFVKDPGFGMRFFRALSVFLADRLRGTIARLGYGKEGDLSSDQILEDELDEGLLDTVSLAGDRFSRMMRILSGAPES